MLGLPAQEVRRVLAYNERTASLDAPLDIDPMLSVGESIPDEHNPPPDLRLEHTEMEAYVQEWLDQLNDKHQRVIEYRYGLNGCDICTLEQLADYMNLTRERVRQIQIEALHSLRRILKRKGVSKEILL
jgi:RNA polymerase nonessential primary-like sigma factor